MWDYPHKKKIALVIFHPSEHLASVSQEEEAAAYIRTLSQRQLRTYEAERTRRRTAKGTTARVQREYHEEQRRVYRGMERAIRAQAGGGGDDGGGNDDDEHEGRGYVALCCDVDSIQTLSKRRGVVVEAGKDVPLQAPGQDVVVPVPAATTMPLAIAVHATSTTDPLAEESYQGYEDDEFEDDEEVV